MNKDIPTFCPSDQADWRTWLNENHQKEQAVWLVYYKKNAPNPNLNWSQAVDEALCFGWIDSVAKTIDEISYKQYFSRRKAKSTWSKVNKDKIIELSKQQRIAPAGWEAIEVAKKNGSWTILDSVERLEIPQDLEAEFEKAAQAKAYFLSLSKSVRKSLLYWIISAKRPRTRAKRIAEIVENAQQGQKPRSFR